MNYLYAHLGLDPQAASPGGAAPPELIGALQGGNMIEAIKIYRSMTGLGLKEAKAAVEGMADRYR